jgi:hypothetical protein
MSRLRTLEASAIWADEGGRLGSLQGWMLVTGLDTKDELHTVERSIIFGIEANGDECPFQTGSSSRKP